jgi:hypothetical protein
MRPLVVEHDAVTYPKVANQFGKLLSSFTPVRANRHVRSFALLAVNADLTAPSH